MKLLVNKDPEGFAGIAQWCTQDPEAFGSSCITITEKHYPSEYAAKMAAKFKVLTYEKRFRKNGT